MVSLDREFNVITEFKNELKPEDIKIFLYSMPIKDINERHSENYAIVQELKKINENPNIVFNEYIIASFNPIINWGKYKDIDVKPDNRNINLDNHTERKILERLLLCDIKNNINNNTTWEQQNKYEIRGNANPAVYLRKPIYLNNNLIIRRKLNFDVNIDKKDIIIGFFLNHEFEYQKTLDEEIKCGNIQKGDKVKDFYNNITYEFLEIAPFSISQENKYMRSSIIEYYLNKGQSYIISGLDKNTKAVLVKNKEGSIFPYIPNRLKKICVFENLGNRRIIEGNKYIKMNPSQNMSESIKLAEDILKNSKYVKFNKANMIVEKIGYKKDIVKRPALKFGKNESNFSAMYGLNKSGSYEQKNIKIDYFIDPKILNNKRDYQIVYSFLNDIISKSKDLGVEINTDKSYINLTPINIKNENEFELNIIQIIENYNNPVLVILEKENIDKYYETLKKIFGGRNSIATQFVDLDTIKRCDPKIDNKRGKESIFLNILLGIYCKSGIQPWVLANGLSADCYIGLDVCRENNMSTAGLIQVIGKDGRVLKSKTISSHQSGEKIQINILKDIIFEAKQAYKNTYNKKLEHIVFHRDGINREDIDLLKEITNSLEIKFDYVEVTKNINRRMAMLEKSDENYNHRDKENKKWITEIGMCLKKENEAYLITTNPSENMGMARPLRIKKVYGNQNMDDIVKDIYKLSFMHIGSIMKSRLPITTHYADLSSIYSHRELMPKIVDNNILHFI